MHMHFTSNFNLLALLQFFSSVRQVTGLARRQTRLADTPSEGTPVAVGRHVASQLDVHLKHTTQVLEVSSGVHTSVICIEN